MDNSFEYRVYLKSLSKQFPTLADAATEIINLQAILSLPKGTEHFLTDIHGEYEQFNHVLKNGSGSVRRKIDEEFGNTLSVKDKRSLATLIYYPQEKLELVCQEEEDQDVLEDWFKITIHRLVQMTKRVSSKYTRSKVRKAMPPEYAYIIDEMLHTHYEDNDKRDYYENIINTIIDLDREKCYIANIVKCRPPRNRDPQPQEQDACIGFLEDQIALLQPKIIVCLGRIAAQRLIAPEFRITRDHGTWTARDGVLYSAMYHPSALLRDPTKRPETFDDLLLLRKKIQELNI